MTTVSTQSIEGEHVLLPKCHIWLIVRFKHIPRIVKEMVVIRKYFPCPFNLVARFVALDSERCDTSYPIVPLQYILTSHDWTAMPFTREIFKATPESLHSGMVVVTWTTLLRLVKSKGFVISPPCGRDERLST